MGEAEPKRRWYRRKRWWASALLWLVVTYPLLLGPLQYAHVRGWVSAELLTAVDRPASLVPPRVKVRTGFARWMVWWQDRAFAAQGQPPTADQMRVIPLDEVSSEWVGLWPPEPAP